MKILVIGCKGFIGSHVNRYFSSLPDYECWGCDIVVDYTSLNYILLDSASNNFDLVFENNSFDYCINCSGSASVPDSFLHPVRDFNLNTFNVFQIFEALRKQSPITILINLSSAGVYGNPLVLPITETTPCIRVSPYGYHKYLAEQICNEYALLYGLGVCSLRIFSAYGPFLYKQIIWDIFQKSNKKSDITLFGTGDESRDFIYIKDIIKIIQIVIDKNLFCNSVFNVASGIEVSIKDLANEIISQANYPGQLIFTGNQRVGDPNNWKADISRINEYGFVPE